MGAFYKEKMSDLIRTIMIVSQKKKTSICGCVGTKYERTGQVLYQQKILRESIMVITGGCSNFLI